MEENLPEQGYKKFSPAEFMRGRRPGLFSDSQIVQERSLTKNELDYHLETLTNRKQEYEFEHFCRKLAQKELCPNLLPQTGPIGGGDSKTDSETYPVSEALARVWYEGIGIEASQERWAFAFSAKKNWKSKVRKDVENIISTKRNYKLIYFITNQYAKDRDRSNIEDELTNKYQVKIRILDKSWIIERVFENERFQIAIDTLNIGKETEEKRILGPKDLQRENDLHELELQIQEQNRYIGVEYQLAEDCLDAALISRGLERPRFEVEGKFDRAERVAKRVGYSQQLLRIIYTKAWTTYWWYEDVAEFERLYNKVEKIALTSNSANDLELLTNLWQIYHAEASRGRLKQNAKVLHEKTLNLKSALDEQARDQDRPNNALQAKTNRLLIDLTEAVKNSEARDDILQEFKKVILASKGLVSFPLTSLVNLIKELGNFLSDNSRYDELFETVISEMESRKSDEQAGRMLLERGYQKLKAGKKYDAIALLGRAQLKLSMHECRSEYISALAGCGLAYEAAGLFWAARANMLAAANQSLYEFWTHGKIIPRALLCLQKLFWLELQLGRVPMALAWKEVSIAIERHLVFDDKSKTSYLDECQSQDQILGILLLKTDFWDLKKLYTLPQLLELLNLPVSSMTLLYTLGYEDYLRTEGFIPEDEPSEEVKHFFWSMFNFKVSADFPDRPDYLDGQKILMTSFVLGCEVVIETPNNISSILFSETILHALEAVLATSLNTEIIPFISKIQIILKPSDFIADMPTYKLIDENEGLSVELRYSSDFKFKEKERQSAFNKWLIEFMMFTLSQIVKIRNPEEYLNKLILQEEVFERAYNFADPSVAIENILGPNPKYSISKWAEQLDYKKFPLLRKEPWNLGLERKHEDEKKYRKLKPGSGNPPEELFNKHNLRHKDRKIESIINIPLWNRAKWSGVMYLSYYDVPPVLALIFENIEQAKAIFTGWIKKLSQNDRNDELRISFITDLSKENPSEYSVVVSSNPKVDGPKELIQLSRYKRMTSSNPQQFQIFIEEYEKFGKFFLMPAHLSAHMGEPRLIEELYIEKKELRLLPAWQLSENDFDSCVLEEDDDPPIPENVKEPPVKKALERIKKYRS